MQPKREQMQRNPNTEMQAKRKQMQGNLNTENKSKSTTSKQNHL